MHYYHTNILSEYDQCHVDSNILVIPLRIPCYKMYVTTLAVLFLIKLTKKSLYFTPRKAWLVTFQFDKMLVTFQLYFSLIQFWLLFCFISVPLNVGYFSRLFQFD